MIGLSGWSVGRAGLVGVFLLPALSFGAIGKVAALAGTATRTAKSASAKSPLAVGTEIELGDKIDVAASSSLKLALNDESVLMVGPESQLEIAEAKFENLDHRAFSAKLLFGKVWANVTKALAGSDAKFEVSAGRAVAGVRGTIFRVDFSKVVSAARPRTLVKVITGKVAVAADVKKHSPDSTVKTTRHQIPGPTEVSKEDWEKKFVELQSHQMVEVGDELWREAAYDPESEHDALAQFVKENK